MELETNKMCYYKNKNKIKINMYKENRCECTSIPNFLVINNLIIFVRVELKKFFFFFKMKYIEISNYIFFDMLYLFIIKKIIGFEKNQRYYVGFHFLMNVRVL